MRRHARAHIRARAPMRFDFPSFLPRPPPPAGSASPTSGRSTWRRLAAPARCGITTGGGAGAEGGEGTTTSMVEGVEVAGAGG